MLKQRDRMKIFQDRLLSRQVEKRLVLYSWVGEFRDCEAEIAAKLLTVGLRQSQIFLKALVDDGLIARRKVSLSLTKNSYLYYITKNGHNIKSGLRLNLNPSLMLIRKGRRIHL